MPKGMGVRTGAGPEGIPCRDMVGVLSFVVHALRSERRQRSSAVGCLIDQALAPNGSVAAASQGLSLHRSR